MSPRPLTYPISEVVRAALDLSTPEGLRTACDREVARYAAWKREAEHCWGLSFYTDPFTPKSLDELRQEAEREEARRNDHRNSPRGQLLVCLKELGEVGYHEAETVRAIYSRSLSDPRDDVDVAAVTRAIRILNSLNHPDARTAIDALCALVAPLPNQRAA